MKTRPKARSSVARFALRLCACLMIAGLLAACAMPGDAAPVVKIGLIAPFEGMGRPLGYAVLPEVKAAVAEMNASGALGRYRVALVALDDDLNPEAAASQARALAQDGAVLAVIGPLSQDTAAAAAPFLSAAGVATTVAAPVQTTPPGVTSLCPPAHAISAVLVQASADLAATSGGQPPLVFFPGDATMAADELATRRADGWQGVMLGGPDVLRPWFIQQAGDAANGTRAVACSLGSAASSEATEVSLVETGARMLLQALASDIQAHGQPSRAGVAAALAQQPLTPQLRWYQVEDGAWRPLP